MDIKLRQIISKSAGTYFIVTDNSQVPVIEEENRLRLVFINSEKGVFNVPVKFAQGDIAGFQSIFGKPKRQYEVQGNFSHQTCIDALQSAGLAVINLVNITNEKTQQTPVDWIFDETFTTKKVGNAVETNYKNLFNTSSFWTLNREGLLDAFTGSDKPLLSFGNVGKSQLSIFVTLSSDSDVSNITDEGDSLVSESSLEFEEYPALVAKPYLKVKDLFVTVWVFGTSFAVSPNTNPYYGHLFDNNNAIQLSNLEALSKVGASGFIVRYTGMYIPSMKNELGDDISIDDVIDNDYINVGLAAYINPEKLEHEDSLKPYLFDAYYKYTGEVMNNTTSLTAKYVNTWNGKDTSDTGTDILPTVFSNVLPTNVIGGGEPAEGDASGVNALKGSTFVGASNHFQPRVTDILFNELADVGMSDVVNYPHSILYYTMPPNYKPDALLKLVEFKIVEGKDRTYRVRHGFGIRKGSILMSIGSDRKYIGIARVTSYGLLETATSADPYQNEAEFTTDITLGDNNLLRSKSLALGGATSKNIMFLKNSLEVGSNLFGTDAYPVNDKHHLVAIVTPPQSLPDAQVTPTLLSGTVVSSDLFKTGSAKELNENVLNLMIAPGIIKGCKGLQGLRYVVDAFKSYVSPSYKEQYITFCSQLDEGNRFVRAILNDVFITDLIKSTNPSFKQAATGQFDLSYLPDGGNKDTSSNLLTKPTLNASFGFYFGSGDVVKGIVKPLAGKISNLFVSKTYQFDVVANQSGYVSGVTGLDYDFDDVERKYCEKFRYNPIINFNGGYTIFGNNTAQKERTAQQQIHNSELLAYIKESLYNLAKSEAFTKGNYDDYLRTEIETKNFMEALVLAGAIDPKPVVICNSSNNTLEIRKQRIKLVHVEYTPVDCIEKVVFDLNIY
jgi:hypothetical protein